MSTHYFGRRLQVGAGRLVGSRRTRLLLHRYHVCLMIRGFYAAARWV